MDINKYRNCINKLIAWEWMILKQLRKSKRRIILPKESFAIFSLLSTLLTFRNSLYYIKLNNC